MEEFKYVEKIHKFSLHVYLGRKVILHAVRQFFRPSTNAL